MQTAAFGSAALIAAAVLTDATAQTDWQRLPLLTHHVDAACAMDTARNRLVLFGGTAVAGRIGELWEWDGSDWLRALPVHSPAPRAEAAAVYDPIRGVVVLFGGSTGAGRQGDTWEWDGIDWTQRTPAGAPPARSLHAMTWDGGRQRVLLFGGFGSQGELDDTWQWDGTTWTQPNPLHRPPARAGTAMAWDAVRDRVVLFGGGACMYWNCGSSDTWEWDGTDWTDVSLPWQASPPFRWKHSMVWDDSRNRVVVFGGSDEPGHYKDDTWEWDGATWTQRAPAYRPVGRLGQSLAYDPATQRTLLTGGDSWVGLVSDLWALDAGGWQLVHPGQQPNAGLYQTADMAWDGDRDGVVWFGMGIGAGMVRQTWVLAGTRWTLVNEDQGPQWPDQHRLQWLPSRHRMIAHQPRLSNKAEQTWEYDGTAWSQVATANLPGTGGAFAIALDPNFDRLVLFGGVVGSGPGSSETWLFDGIDWTRATPASSPPGRSGHAMTLDAPRGRVVLFGGNTGAWPTPIPDGDTWEWDGDTWLQRMPANAPSPRMDHRMTFDCGRRRVILHGGSDASGNRSDTWEWDGSDWTERSTVTAPPPTWRKMFAHDVRRGATVQTSASDPGSTWRYGPDAAGEFVAFGSGCGGSLGAPRMLPELAQRPYVGVDFHLALLQLPGPIAFGASGFSNTSWFGVLPLPYNLAPLGYPSCDLRVQTDFVVLLALNNGQGMWNVHIPADPGLVGVHFFTQVLAFDPAGLDGLAMTAGGAGTIGGL